MKKVLIYTDCSFFAGCENVLENIVSYQKITNTYEIIYCYRDSKKYATELQMRSIPVETKSIQILTNDDLKNRLQKLFGGSIFFKVLFLS